MVQSIFKGGEVLNSQRHTSLRYSPETGCKLFADQASAPVTIAEFSAVAAEYPILFAPAEAGASPVALFALKEGTNLFVDRKGRWTGHYIPAHFRQLPFFNTHIRDSDKIVLSVLPEAESVHESGDGLALFDEDGQASEFLKAVMEFTRQHYEHTVTTQKFCRLLAELDLLEETTGTITLPDKSRRILKGLSVVSRKKLHALDDAKLAEFERNGALEAIHLHWASMRNFENLGERMSQSKKAEPLERQKSVVSIAQAMSASVQ
ncbi:SapC family protein [Thioclava pacifica]|uniref:SapC family protein n=1 Tax=Thioclava pacifica DSM 10166 TaxID=1353537 RepID=A0A074J6E8_9RHOB|nr:SapC family protein [Thioclava pacifica]KEO51148.1 hypothetical protein TP2_12175 [Thioclava pacifica DSM 10166]